MSTPSRRQFLAFLASSPVLAAAGVDQQWLAALTRSDTSAAQDQLIARAQDALDVFDLERVAQTKIPVAHWGYLITGSDDDATHSRQSGRLRSVGAAPTTLD